MIYLLCCWTKWLYLNPAVAGEDSRENLTTLQKLPTESFKLFFDSNSTEQDNDFDISLDTLVDVIIYLQHPNVDLLYNTLKEVSDPTSEHYGFYKTHEELSGIVGRSDEELDMIKIYLLSELRSSDLDNKEFIGADVFNISRTKDQMFVRTTIKELQALFDNKFGYIGDYNLSHRGSDVLISHRLLNGDESQEDLKSHLPYEISQLIESIYVYLPVEEYPMKDYTYGRYMPESYNTAFPSFIKSDIEPETEGFAKVLQKYDLMNPLSLQINPIDGPRIIVLEGSRGVGTTGVIHFILTKEDGSMRVEEGETAAKLCGEKEKWKNIIHDDAKHVKTIELLLSQNGTPSVLSYPFEEDFIQADCHRACNINNVVNGTCIMYQIKFQMKAYRPATVKARAIFNNGTKTSWDGGSLNPDLFYSNTIVDLSIIEQLYGIEGYPTQKDDRDSIVVGTFLEEQFDPKDIYNYVKAQGVPVSNFNDRLSLVGTINPYEGRSTGIEATLDIEIIMSLARNHEIIAWNVPGRELSSEREPFLRLMYQLSCWNEEYKPLPSILSLSYGDEEVLGIKTYLYRLDREFAKLGILGITVIAASGDDGANGMKSRGNSPNSCSISGPGYPPSMPSVTSVGATQLSKSVSPMCHSSIMILPPLGHMECERIGEVAAETDEGGALITSGGGFSYYFDNNEHNGWYQIDHIKSYIENVDVLPPNTFYNDQGRGFPDLAVIGTNVPIMLGNNWALLSGTSVSAPIATGVVANVLESIKYRYNLSKYKLGFMSPVLYKLSNIIPSVYNDIVVGRNNCGYKEMECCPYGFNASSGWDPVSGLGSINVDAFAEAYTQLIDNPRDECERTIPEASLSIEIQSDMPSFHIINK